MLPCASEAPLPALSIPYPLPMGLDEVALPLTSYLLKTTKLIPDFRGDVFTSIFTFMIMLVIGLSNIAFIPH